MPVKPQTGLISDVVISLLAEDVQTSSGLSFDIGSTIGKIIYRSKEEYKNGQPITPQDDSKMGKAHFAMFPRADVKGMIKYCKEHCDLTANEDGVIVVYSSGVGGAAFKSEIETELTCKLDILPEFDCFCKAFLALEKILPEEELFTPLNRQIKENDEEMKAQLEPAMEKAQAMTETKFHDDDKDDMKDEDRPRLLVMAGSGTGIMQIKKDGTFGMLDGCYTAGRFMYGLAAILTGEHDFRKLTEMAEAADGKTVDTYFSDLIGQGQGEGCEENVYNTLQTDMLLFPFGKGITLAPDEIKKEDLVYSVFNTTAMFHAQMLSTNIKLSKAKHVYFCGNTFNSELMQILVCRMKSMIVSTMTPNMHYEYHFLANGGMYGALGAFLYKKTSD